MGTFQDITGQRFNDWTAIAYMGEGKWLFECACARHTRRILEGRSVKSGRSKSCGLKDYNDITGQVNNTFKAIKYIGHDLWECECTECGKIRKLNVNKFTTEDIVCSHRNKDGTTRIKQKNHSDYEGKQFGSFIVKEYIKGGLWDCECTICGKHKVIRTYALTHNKNTCNHTDINIGDKFNDWEVIEIVDNTHVKCRCHCSKDCDNTSIISKHDLMSNKSKSCGAKSNKFKDLTGQMFGNWKVLEYIGNSMWKCECQCENHTIKNIHTYSLRTGNSKSCGCKKRELMINTKIDRYGEISKDKLNKTRESWQIEIINNAELLKDYLDENGKTTISELAESLGVNYSTILQRLKKFNLDEHGNIQYSVSLKEKELVAFIKSIYSGHVITNTTNIIPFKEIDIYIPEKKLAIEFNGNYWHSDKLKSRKYHQQKTAACAKQGIQLIHFFEYEWDNMETRAKILGLISDKLGCNQKTKVFARCTSIKNIDASESKQFLEKYHLQKSANSSIQLGCYKDNELLGVMTFGKPRFSNNYEYEIIRLCWNPKYAVIGGTEKLFKYFISKYSPKSIITYVDISKFKGEVYDRLRFKAVKPNCITEPNYVWVYSNTNTVIPRYQAQKHRLIKMGLGTEDQTEDEIMDNHNYLKVYDAGNLKLEWTADKA